MAQRFPVSRPCFLRNSDLRFARMVYFKRRTTFTMEEFITSLGVFALYIMLMGVVLVGLITASCRMFAKLKSVVISRPLPDRRPHDL